jgi:hypothetical protein
VWGGGGRSFNLPEQAAMLMKLAFEALSNTSSILSKLEEDSLVKDKVVVVIESMEDLSKPNGLMGQSLLGRG